MQPDDLCKAMARLNHVLPLFVCLACVVTATSLDSWESGLDFIPDDDNSLVLARACNGPNKACAEPLTGPNITIWHGDGSCTYMYVGCSLSGMQLEFFSPSHASKNWITWMGGSVSSQLSPPRPEKCTKFNELSVGSGYGHTTSASTLFDRNDCGTVFGDTPNGDDTQVQNVKLVEFLHVFGAPGSTSLSLVTHENIKVKCCMSTDMEPATCLRAQPTVMPLTACSGVEFELKCVTNEDEERFYCDVKLSEGQTLGNPDVAFYVDKCAVSSESAGTFLFSEATLGSGPVANDNLNVARQFNGARNPDDAQYSFRFPYVQFVDPVVPHKLKVECSVNVMLKNEVPASAYLGLAPSWS